MVKLNELFKGSKKIKIIVEDEDYKSFLQYAKQEGCLWKSGEVIKPNISKPSGYTKVVAVTSDMLIYHPTGWISNMSLQSAPEYLYKNLKEDKVIDEYFERTYRTERFNKEFEASREAEKQAFKIKCEENRKLSQLQLKYSASANKLQKQVFVRYENNDELLNLFLLLKKYGYENIYDITLNNFSNDPKIICVNNESMTFYPAKITDCDCALKAKKKLYKADVFEKMIASIYD